MFDVSYESVRSRDFKEDSVREEIITPMLKKLGYRVEGDAKILRSRPLRHPFIYVGTTQHEVKTIPDYTLQFKDKPVLVLDAKSPIEDLLSKKYIQQAYSYAVHPEIRCQHFALCNGLRLVLFSQESDTPILDIGFEEFESRWHEIEKYLNPHNLNNPILRNFAPDAGLMHERLGLTGVSHWIGARPGYFGKLTDDEVTISSNIVIAEMPYCISFDMPISFMPKILACLPSELSTAFMRALSRSPFQADSNHVIELDLVTVPGEKVVNEHDSFIPFRVLDILGSRLVSPALFNPQTPSNIFQLGKFIRFE